MLSYKDKTFCASPNCKNECGRKLTDTQQQEAIKQGKLISYGYFCGEPTSSCCSVHAGTAEQCKEECEHESDGNMLLSYPGQYKCLKCGEFYR